MQTDELAIWTKAEARYATLREVIETAENVGKMIIIDTLTGDFEIDPEGIAASHRLEARHPSGVAPCGLRIGYDAVYSFGGRPERTKQ